jgi:LL-diaminopimelate aminotransferase
MLASSGGAAVRFARRLDAVPPYLFAELERKVAEKERQGIDVISLGIGDPDLPTPEPVVKALAAGARDPATHRYPTNHGSQDFRNAGAHFYRERFGVELDPGSEIVPALGGKEAVGHICLALLDPGDVCLSPDPGYPPYTSGPLFAGAEVRYLPLEAAGGFLPNLDAVPEDVASRANLLFLNYPNNPTGAVVAPGYFEHAVELARRHGLVVVHDNAYSEICFDGYRAPSFLETPGAKEVGVEIFSLSKGWNMTGWRSGLVAGNAEVVERYRQLKTNLDSGMFEAVQRATVAALTEARDFPREMSEVYRRRRDLVADGLEAIGLRVEPPRATPYFWVRVPNGHTSESFTELVLEEAAVVVSPGPAYGPTGEGYFRISLTVPDEQLAEAVRRIEALGVKPGEPPGSPGPPPPARFAGGSYGAAY